MGIIVDGNDSKNRNDGGWKQWWMKGMNGNDGEWKWWIEIMVDKNDDG